MNWQDRVYYVRIAIIQIKHAALQGAHRPGQYAAAGRGTRERRTRPHTEHILPQWSHPQDHTALLTCSHFSS
jgi:hypothetical protein